MPGHWYSATGVPVRKMGGGDNPRSMLGFLTGRRSAMRSYGLPPFFFLLVLAIAITLACGSPVSHIAPSCSSAPTVVNPGMPQSVIVCPAVADAKDYPDGQVQLIAIGSFNTQPTPALPKPVLWGACQQNQFTTGVTVSGGGVAQCASGASGAYTVWATGGPVVCNVIGPCGACGPTGTAQLTCP